MSLKSSWQSSLHSYVSIFNTFIQNKLSFFMFDQQQKEIKHSSIAHLCIQLSKYLYQNIRIGLRKTRGPTAIIIVSFITLYYSICKLDTFIRSSASHTLFTLFSYTTSYMSFSIFYHLLSISSLISPFV